MAVVAFWGCGSLPGTVTLEMNLASVHTVKSPGKAAFHLHDHIVALQALWIRGPLPGIIALPMNENAIDSVSLR